eukprot:CAMPEP_0185835158 /NCGR_PEP_ID=MMETSP1353-20130828/7178_1 /TAXON_ID=1077150 /ORGANISM="Erythrolobus australicus, Strain CCMP3124" /LENGTH=69 /DNA_ID=CAMNT_0028533737 /DNA_START=1 /DNA_END=207 /DNA_ORIENTATION=+
MRVLMVLIADCVAAAVCAAVSAYAGGVRIMLGYAEQVLAELVGGPADGGGGSVEHHARVHAARKAARAF